MLVKDRFTARRKPSEETLVGALAVSGGEGASSDGIAVSIAKVDAERQRVKYEISYYTEPEDVADPETGDFHPGIEATAHSDWFFEVQLVSKSELSAILAKAGDWDLIFSIPVPELDLVLFGAAYGD